jgi:hypothetical protein
LHSSSIRDPPGPSPGTLGPPGRVSRMVGFKLVRQGPRAKPSPKTLISLMAHQVSRQCLQARFEVLFQRRFPCAVRPRQTCVVNGALKVREWYGQPMFLCNEQRIGRCRARRETPSYQGCTSRLCGLSCSSIS